MRKSEFISKHGELPDCAKRDATKAEVLNGANRQEEKSIEAIFFQNFDPNASTFGRSGRILSRTTISSRILRKWQDTFWVHLLPATLVVFRSEESFKKWAPKERRCGKVLLMLDFDTLGTLKTRRRDEESIENENFRAPTTKLISSVQKYSLGGVEATLRGSEALYACRLERLSSVGVDIIGSFASTSPTNLRSFRQVIQNCIQATTPCKSRSKRTKSKRSKMLQFDSTHHSTEINSAVTYSTCQSHCVQMRGQYVRL